MTARDLDRIRFVTRHFNDLQGLRYWVPIGLLTLSVGGTTYFANRPFLILRAAFFLAALLLFFGARWYYRRTFGEVDRQPVLPAAETSTGFGLQPSRFDPWARRFPAASRRPPFPGPYGGGFHPFRDSAGDQSFLQRHRGRIPGPGSLGLRNDLISLPLDDSMARSCR